MRVITITDSPVTGALSYVQLRKETTYGSDAAGTDMAFGHGVSTEPTRRNNIIPTRGLGSRNAEALVAGRFEGRLDVPFILSNNRWFAAVLGASGSAAAGAAYDHTYTEADTIPSMTVEEGTNLGTTDHVAKFLGCKVNELTLRCNVGERVDVTMSMIYKTETEGSSLDGTPAAEAEAPMFFAQGSLDLPSGSTLARVQSIDLRINNNLIPSYGLGSRLLGALTEGNRDYTFTINKTFEVASDMLEKFYGGVTGPSSTTIAETATLVLTFTNGLAAGDERTLVITLTGVKLDEDTLPKTTGEVTLENVTGIGRTMGAVGTDATATSIFD